MFHRASRKDWEAGISRRCPVDSFCGSAHYWQGTECLSKYSRERGLQLQHRRRPAGEIHHRVFRIVDGADDDWASWYADWLINLSELPALLGVKPVRSELAYLLVSLDKEYTAGQPGEPWEAYYAQRVLRHFSPPGS